MSEHPSYLSVSSIQVLFHPFTTPLPCPTCRPTVRCSRPPQLRPSGCPQLRRPSAVWVPSRADRSFAGRPLRAGLSEIPAAEGVIDHFSVFYLCFEPVVSLFRYYIGKHFILQLDELESKTLLPVAPLKPYFSSRSLRNSPAFCAFAAFLWVLVCLFDRSQASAASAT